MRELTQDKAPIFEALERFKQMRVVPFDVPGHKRGRGNPELVNLLGEKCVGIDVNSMKPLDNLCHPVSVIAEAEQLAAEAFGAAHAFLMVGGTTSAVQSMILSVVKRGDKIILPRNVHRSVVGALILCGAVPVYVNPECDMRLGIPLGMKVEQVEKAIKENPDAKAVLVNNPTYYGICSNLREIVRLAHSHGMLCLADEAHGTHFYFGENLPVSANSGLEFTPYITSDNDDMRAYPKIKEGETFILPPLSIVTFVSESTVPSSITEEPEEINIHIYPNPIVDEATVNSRNTIRNITVYDVYGKVVYQQAGINDNMCKLFLPGFSAGIYIASIETDEGYRIQKIVKK